LPVVGLVPGNAQGPAMAPTEHRGEAAPGSIVVIPDGRPEFAHAVIRAGGVVLAGGGLLNPMAQLARELGITAVACVQRVPIQRFPLGSMMAIDGTLGALSC
jgi:phosphohistidine swiveling domain-containing protein